MLKRLRLAGAFLIPAAALSLVLLQPRPDRPALARRAAAASELGWSRMVERLTRPALTGIGGGGWVRLIDAVDGRTAELGPRVFVESQVYDLDWFLRGLEDGLGRPGDDALAAQAAAILLKTQHPKGGHWPWSDDGCVHESMALTLLRLGHRAEAERALDWAMRWAEAGHVRPDGTVLEVESAHLMKSWGPGPAPPTPSLDEAPPPPKRMDIPSDTAPDELPLLLRLLAASGRERRYPEMARRLRRGLDRMIRDFDYGPAESADFKRLFGLIDYAAAVRDGILPRDELYAQCLRHLAFLARREARKIPEDPLVLGLLLIGVTETDLDADLPETADRLAAGLLSLQSPGGEWEMPPFVFQVDWVSWGRMLGDLLPGKPGRVLSSDRVVGRLESLPTYLAARALRSYARSAGAAKR